MKLTFFGRLRDAVGAVEIECLPPTNIVDSESLRTWISEKHPALAEATVRIALDDVLTAGPTSLAGVSEVAFLPPVSGG